MTYQEFLTALTQAAESHLRAGGTIDMKVAIGDDDGEMECYEISGIEWDNDIQRLVINYGKRAVPEQPAYHPKTKWTVE